MNVAVTDRVSAEVSRTGLEARGTGGPPPRGSANTGGPDDDRNRLMLAIYNARGAGPVSLEYLRRRTGFSRERLWRTLEALEDAGYVKAPDKDPRSPVVRWMDRPRNANARVFASTFVELTEAGLCTLGADKDTEEAPRGRGDEDLARLNSIACGTGAVALLGGVVAIVAIL